MSNNALVYPTSIEELSSLIEHHAEQVIERKLAGKPIAQPDEFLPITEASELVNLKVSSIYFYVAKKRIPFIKRTGRLLFSKKELTEWLLNGKKAQVCTGKEVPLG